MKSFIRRDSGNIKRMTPRSGAGKATPWAYRETSSLLHKIPAGIKLLSLLLLSLAAFFPSLPLLLGLALFICALSFAAGVGPFSLLRGSFPLFFVILAVFFIEAFSFSPLRFDRSGLLETLVFMARIGTAFCAGSLFFTVTTTSETRKALARLENILHLEKFRLSLSIALMLSFIPRFFEIWEDLNLAWKARAGKKNFSRLVTLLPIAIERMMKKAAETAAALEARGVE